MPGLWQVRAGYCYGRGGKGRVGGCQCVGANVIVDQFQFQPLGSWTRKLLGKVPKLNFFLDN